MPEQDPRTPVEILLNAKSIAIIGASDSAVKPSGRTQRYLAKYGFEGAIYPINPTRETVQGVASYASLDDLPEVPELAVIVLPQSDVEAAIEQCGRLGVTFAIVFASGYAELGADGAALQESLLATARRAGVRVLGPNSVGAVSAGNALTTTFMTGLDQNRFELTDEGIAFVSQSGAMGGFILNMAQSAGAGVGRFFSTGNEADLSFSELVGQLVDEGSTRVVLGYVEGIRDGQAFQAALGTARASDVPMAVMKVGRSARGAAAAASHTGALAGADAVFDGVFRRFGVHRATDVEHLLDLGQVFSRVSRPAGNRVSIVTLSGGAGVLMTDYAEDLGLDVFPWSEEWQARMREVLPPYASFTNPIDTTGAIAANQVMMTDALEVCLENPETDMLLVLLGNLEMEEGPICERIIDIASRTDKPILVTWVGGSGYPARTLSAAGIPTFGEPARTMRAASALAQWAETSRRDVVPTPAPSPLDVDLTPVEEAMQAGKSYLDEVAAKSLLASAGIRTVKELEADSADGAWAAAQEIGLPVVLKLLSDEVAHKTEHNAVRVGLVDEQEIRTAADEILAVAKSLDLSDHRLVLQEMVSSTTELILGMTTDPVFGPVVLLGIGGVLTEVVADVQIRPAPVTLTEAHTMIDDLRGVALLRGVRGRVAVDEDDLAATIAVFSELCTAAASSVESIEINPLLIDGHGHPVAVDALVVVKTSTSHATPEVAS